MSRQRAKRRASTSPPSPADAPAARALHYKVVELSNVDEGALERTLNEYVPRGWKFDGVQFAMRESSKRPSMAFVFFTREGEPLPAPQPWAPEGFRDEVDAHAHLKRLAQAETPKATSTDAWSRLQALAHDDEDGGAV